VVAGCHTAASRTEAQAPVVSNESAAEGTVVGDEENGDGAAIEGRSAGTESSEVPRKGIPLADNAPDSYVVKRWRYPLGYFQGFFCVTLGIGRKSGRSIRRSRTPHLIYPGDTLRLVFIDGRPQILLQRGDAVRVEPRVRSQPLESAITTIPYATVAAFMSKPSVLDRDQIKHAPYLLATRDLHVVMSEGRYAVRARIHQSPPNWALITMWCGWAIH